MTRITPSTHYGDQVCHWRAACRPCHDHNNSDDYFILPCLRCAVLATGKPVGSISTKLRYLMSAHSRGVCSLIKYLPCRPAAGACQPCYHYHAPRPFTPKSRPSHPHPDCICASNLINPPGVSKGVSVR